MATRSARPVSAFKDSTVYEEKVTQLGEHYYHPYYVGRLLGTGGFAYCHEVRTINDSNKYAIKIIPKVTDIDPKKKREAAVRIREEISIIKSLKHPGIVKYYRDFSDNRNTYIIMELCTGGSLSDILKKRKVLSQPEVRYFIAQMVDIMKYLKERNIIHRDIKLANYLLDDNFKVKLADFGLATQTKEASKMADRRCGTPNYMAPEVIEKAHFGFQTDAWATGVLVFTLLYGGPPFETKTCKETYVKIRKCEFEFKGARNMEIVCSQDAQDFIRQLLCLDVSRRMKFEQFMGHPFMCRFNIPKQLDLSFPASPPSSNFLETFGKPIRGAARRKKTYLPRPAIVAAPAPTPTPPKQVRIIPKFQCRVTYRNALKGSPPKPKPIMCQGFDDDEVPVKIEEVQEEACKEEEPVSLAQPCVKAQVPILAVEPMIKKEEALGEKVAQKEFEEPQSPTKEIEVQKKEEEEEKSSSTNIRGRKKFLTNTNPIVAQMGEQTQRKPRTSKNLPNKDKTELSLQKAVVDEWIRPSLKLKLKQINKEMQLNAEKAEIKVLHWQKCSKKYGISYVLSNHLIGFLFEDADCMQFTPKDDKIHYFSRKQGRTIHREIKVTEIEELREPEPSLLAKVQILLHYRRGLRDKFPYLEDKTERESTSASVNDCAVQTCIKSFRKGVGMHIFTLSNGTNQFFFEDGSKMFFSLSSYIVSYRKGESLLVYSIPLTFKDLEEEFKQKVQMVCDHYNRVLKVKPGEGTERWLLKQNQDDKKQSISKVQP